MDRELFQDYKYDAYQEYQSAATHARECETTLKRLKDAQKNNREFMELSQLKAQLEDELTAIQREKNAQLDVKPVNFTDYGSGKHSERKNREAAGGGKTVSGISADGIRRGSKSCGSL